MWNSVLSTEGAKYMCLDIKNFYLSAPLDRFEYMKILLALFLQWIIEQNELNTHALNGFIYLENVMSHMGPSPSWHPCQQAPLQTTPPTWIL
jgi:hypothetical protein